MNTAIFLTDMMTEEEAYDAIMVNSARLLLVIVLFILLRALLRKLGKDINDAWDRQYKEEARRFEREYKKSQEKNYKADKESYSTGDRYGRFKNSSKNTSSKNSYQQKKTYDRSYRSVSDPFYGMSPKEAAKKYKSMARKAHPDNGGSEEEMSELNMAYADYRRRTEK